MSSLFGWYARAAHQRPVLTMSLTNAALMMLSDGIAQTFEKKTAALKQQQQQQRQQQHSIDEDSLAAADSKHGYDYARTLRMGAFGIIVAPALNVWYTILERRLPFAVSAAASKYSSQYLATACKRTLADQVVWAPFGTAFFFSFVTLGEGKGWEGVKKKFDLAYWDALKANWTLWPAVQMVNFLFVPLVYRVQYVSTFALFWNAYLSWLNNSKSLQITTEMQLEQRVERAARAIGSGREQEEHEEAVRIEVRN